MIEDEIKHPHIGEEQEERPPGGKGVKREGMPGRRGRESRIAQEGALISGMPYGRDRLQERGREGQKLKQAEEKKEEKRQLEGAGRMVQ